MITDKIDGDLARKHNLITDFGKIADPIADKAITGMAFIGLSIVGDIWWWVTIVVLLREWSVTLLRLSVLKDVVIPAAQSGKIKTVLQAVALAGLIWPLPHGDAHGGAFDFWPGPLGEVLFYLEPGPARRRGRDDDVVGLRVLPRGPQAARLTRPLRSGPQVSPKIVRELLATLAGKGWTQDADFGGLRG